MIPENTITAARRKTADSLKFAFPEELPISAHAESIAGKLRENDVVIVCGTTGSGKTTQLPKIALKAGCGRTGRIGCTQPRKIAASSLCKRVSAELNTAPGGIVGYKVRFDDTTSRDTLIKCMTDGILLAETREGLPEGTDYIRNATECLSSVQAVANALLIVLLTKQYFSFSAEKASSRPQEMTKQLLSGENVDTESLFAGVETEMEAISEEIMGLEASLMFIKENLEKQVGELMLSVVYQRLLTVQRLSSSSAYAALTEPVVEEKEGYLKQIKDAFLADIDLVVVMVKHDEIKQNAFKLQNKFLNLHSGDHIDIVHGFIPNVQVRRLTDGSSEKYFLLLTST